MIKIKNLKIRSFKNKKKILLQIKELLFKKGSISLILGKNATGKSSFLKTIARFPGYQAEGEILIKNKKQQYYNILNFDYNKTIEEGILFCMQEAIEIKGLSNFEFLFHIFLKRNFLIDRPTFQETIIELCNKIGIHSDIIFKKNVNFGFSGGERKKNEILKIFLFKPKILLLDEIDSGLDINFLKKNLIYLNNFIKKHKITTLIVSHNKELIRTFQVDNVFILKKSKFQQYSKEQILNNFENLI